MNPTSFPTFPGTSCISTKNACYFRIALTISIALTIIGTLAASNLFFSTTGGFVFLSVGLSLLIAVALRRVSMIKKEDPSPYQAPGFYAGFTSASALNPSWINKWYDLTTSSFGTGFRQFFYIVGKKKTDANLSNELIDFNLRDSLSSPKIPHVSKRPSYFLSDT